MKAPESIAPEVVEELVKALRAIERRLRQHPDDTADDDRRDKRKAHMIAELALLRTRSEGEGK